MGNRVCIVIPLFHHQALSFSEKMPLLIYSLRSVCSLHMQHDITSLALLFVLVKSKTETFFSFFSLILNV